MFQILFNDSLGILKHLLQCSLKFLMGNEEAEKGRPCSIPHQMILRNLSFPQVMLIPISGNIDRLTVLREQGSRPMSLAEELRV